MYKNKNLVKSYVRKKPNTSNLVFTSMILMAATLCTSSLWQAKFWTQLGQPLSAKQQHAFKRSTEAFRSSVKNGRICQSKQKKKKILPKINKQCILVFQKREFHFHLPGRICRFLQDGDHIVIFLMGNSYLHSDADIPELSLSSCNAQI